MKSFYEIIVEQYTNQQLNELFEPREVIFGTNYPKFNNGQISKRNITYFNFQKKIVRVNLTHLDNTVILKFAVSDPTKEIYKLDAELDSDVPYEVKFHTNTQYIIGNIDNPFLLFNNIIYILLEYVEKNNVKNIAFEGADSKLMSFYNSIVNNKKVLNKFSELGFKYNKQDSTEKTHIFTRI